MELFRCFSIPPFLEQCYEVSSFEYLRVYTAKVVYSKMQVIIIHTCVSLQAE